MYSGSSASSVSGSEWLNSFIQSNMNGEVVGILPHQLFISFDNDKTIKQKRLVCVLNSSFLIYLIYFLSFSCLLMLV